MKSSRIISVLSLVFILLVFLSACSNSNTASSSTDTSSIESIQPPTDATVVLNPLPTPDPKVTIDSLLGSWVDIDDSTRFANITKTDSGYQYQDNDGTYEATFQNGVLTVKVSDTDSAQTYFDNTSGNLITTYQDGFSKYKKN